MISRDHLHSLVLVPIGELMPKLDPKSKSRLAWAITNRLHPTVIEQILREAEHASRNGDHDHGRSAKSHDRTLPPDAGADDRGVLGTRNHLIPADAGEAGR